MVEDIDWLRFTRGKIINRRTKVKEACTVRILFVPWRTDMVAAPLNLWLPDYHKVKQKSITHSPPAGPSLQSPSFTCHQCCRVGCGHGRDVLDEYYCPRLYKIWMIWSVEGEVNDHKSKAMLTDVLGRSTVVSAHLWYVVRPGTQCTLLLYAVRPCT